MNESHLRNVIEAALLAAGKPLQPAELVALFDEGARPQMQDIQAALAALTAEYSNRGIEIKETAAGFRIQVRREMANEISRLWSERPARYSRALLETLALIAYRQPITRAEIEAVRGVAVNPNILKTVIERNWVRVVGHRDVPGRPELLGTTRDFLDYFGLRSLDELPPLAELKAMGEYNLQLELPNAGALGIESSGTGVVGDSEVAGVAVAGLLVSELAGADAAGFDARGGADAGDAARPDATAGEVKVIAAEFGETGAASAENADIEAADAEAADIEGAGTEAAGIAAAPSMKWAAVAESHGAGNGEDSDVVEAAAVSEASDADGADESDGDDDGVDDDVEADRTLSADFAANSGGTSDQAAAHSDDSDAADSAVSGKPTGALGDTSADDDDDDEDELSADGHDSRELVAAPRDVDD